MDGQAKEFDGLEDLLVTIRDSTDGKYDQVSDILKAVGGRSFGTFLATIGIIGALPLVGDIPGMTIVIGLLSIIVAVQMLTFRHAFWLPGKVLSRKLPNGKLETGINKALPWIRKIDRLIRPRMVRLTRRKTGIWLAGCVTLTMGVFCIPMEFIPFAGTVPCLGLAIVGIALTARDGYALLLSIAFAIGSAGLLYWAIEADKIPFL